MADNSGDAAEHQRSTSPSVVAQDGADVGDQQPHGHPFPPPGFQGYYGYAAQDGGDGSPAFFGFQGTMYQTFTGSNGTQFLPMNVALAPATSFVNKSKRKQVKNACINCAQACKRCDNLRPCERCKKYNLQASCMDSARKERKKGVKRGPYKRRLKGQVVIDDDVTGADGEWLPSAGTGSGEASSGQGAGGFAPEGYYTYPYPYPFAAVAGQDGQAEGTFQPPPHLFQHLHPAGYPPFPPWVQAPFDMASSSGGAASGATEPVTGSPTPANATTAPATPATNGATATNGTAAGAVTGGSARTSGKKKKSSRRASGEEGGSQSRSSKKSESAAARASRAAKRAIAPEPNGMTHHGHVDENGVEEDHEDGMNGLDVDLSGVTDPSLLDHESAHLGTVDPQATTTA